MTKDQGKLATQLIFTDAARSLRKGYLNIGRVIRDVNKVEEAMQMDEDGDSVLQSIQKMTEASAKKDEAILALTEEVKELRAKVSK
tara:strand:+ start:736 stop:993 length:258 start_codon:yes stop_codon:yes gene_type:complete